MEHFKKEGVRDAAADFGEQRGALVRGEVLEQVAGDVGSPDEGVTRVRTTVESARKDVVDGGFEDIA